MDWGIPTGENTSSGAIKTNLDPTMWYRVRYLGVYQFYTYSAASGLSVPSGRGVTRYIPPMQAFWVRVTSEPGQVEFNNSIRSHRDIAANMFRAPAADTKQVLRFKVSNGTYGDEAIIAFIDNALDTRDCYDSEKMTSGNVNIPEIFIMLDGKEIVINGMAKFTGEKNVNLGFRTLLDAQADYTLQLNEMKGFPEGTVVKVKNNISLNEILMTEGAVLNFSSGKLTNRNTFTIYITIPENSTPEVLPDDSDKPDPEPEYQQNITVSTRKNGQIVVKCLETIERGATVTVWNSDGVRLATAPLRGETTVINIKFAPGIYSVVVNNGGVITNRKIIVG